MTDKEQYNLAKAENRKYRNKKKMLNFLKADISRKLNYEIGSLTKEDRESEVANLLAQLDAVEVNDLKTRRNKFNSSAYSFEVVKRKR